MYHAHFGLEKSLFGDGIAADSAVFRSPKHDQLIASFKLALGSPSSAIVLRGPAGVGKTTLTSAALRASSTRLALAWLNGTPTNAAELLELVLVELGLGTARTTRIERLQLWRQFQAETRATESRLFVVVERTEDFTPEVLHALDSLTAADAAGNLGANVVLIGHAGIDEHLAAPLLDSLRQRIRLRAQLAPFSEAELQDFLRHQIACAGGHFDHVFAPGSVAALYRHSKGIARLAKNLCETSLDYAASQQKKLLTPELVNHTAVALLGLEDTAPAAAATPATPPAASQPAIPRAPVTTAPVVAAAIAAPLPPPVTVVAPAPVVVAPAPAAAAAPAPVVVAPAPVVTAAPAPISVPAPIATAPVPPPNATANPVAPPAAAVPVHVPFEYDGGATDITDVAMADFPVLTDAVELPIVLPPIKRVVTAAPPAPPAAAVAPPAAAKTPPSPAPVARTAAPAPTPPAAARPAASRVETAYAPKPPAAKAAAPLAPPPAPAPAAQKPATPAPARMTPADPEADDVLRQTQTMRAISVAKSIDDISSSMAETLFGDAELDLMTAALASAADWPADEQPTAAPSAAAPSKPAPAAAKAEAPPPPIDDPFDLFGLGDDAPLELIDDSTLPPIDKPRKSAAR